MKNFEKIILALSLAFITKGLVYAQPSEELPVITVQEMSEEEKRLFLPDENAQSDDGLVYVNPEEARRIQLQNTQNNSAVSPQSDSQVEAVVTQQSQQLNNAPKPITVGGGGITDVTPAKLEAPVEGAINGLNFGAGLNVTPIGFAYLNAQRWHYFSIAPSFNFGTKLVTSSKKTMDMSIGYDFIWQEFLDAGPVSRGFENTVSVNFSGQLNDQWSYSFGGLGDWYLLSGPDEGAENYFYLASTPTLSLKVNDQVKLSMSYYVDYFQILNASVSLLDSIGGDFDADAYGGGLFSDAVLSPNSDDGFLTDLGLSNPTADLAFLENKLGMTTSYTPVKGTTLQLNYRYAFNVYSNNPNVEYKGHFLRPKISQDITWWDGGSVSYELRVRQRFYDNKLEGDQYAANRRLRHKFGLSQKITDKVSSSLAFQHEVNSNNADNYQTKKTSQTFAMSFGYTF